MTELLDRAEIDAALTALPGWSLEDGKLVKRAQVPADSQDALIESVGRVRAIAQGTLDRALQPVGSKGQVREAAHRLACRDGNGVVQITGWSEDWM